MGSHGVICIQVTVWNRQILLSLSTVTDRHIDFEVCQWVDIVPEH